MLRKIKGKDLFDDKETLSKREIKRHVEAYVATTNAKPHINPSQDVENKLIEDIDRHKVLEEFLMELLPQWNRAKQTTDPNEILHQSAPHAARALMASLFTSDGKVRNQAAKEILDRELGKPIERSMNINADIHRMNSMEIDNDILRIFKKLGPEAITDLASLAQGIKPGGPEVVAPQMEGEGTSLGRIENTEVQAK